MGCVWVVKFLVFVVRYLLVLRVVVLLLDFVMICGLSLGGLVLFRFGVCVVLVTIDLLGGFVWAWVNCGLECCCWLLCEVQLVGGYLC